MKSARIKLVHEVAGRPMVAYVLEASAALPAGKRIVVLGNQADRVAPLVPVPPFTIVMQKEQRGTGHAVQQAEKALAGARGDLLVLNGDLPGIQAETLRRFIAAHRRSGAAASLLTAHLEDPAGYGRVIRDGKGGFSRIVEHADASAGERAITEINTGIYCFDLALLFKMLKKIRPANKQGEYYLPDVLGLLLKAGKGVRALEHDEAWEILGVNSRADLCEAALRLNERRLLALLDGGVTILDPASTRVDAAVKVGADTVLHPGTALLGATVIGRDVTVGQGTVIRDSKVGDGVTFLPYCVVTEAIVGSGTRVGPFAHLRPGTDLSEDVHIGNFVETKKARLGRGSKANHLTYLGDTKIGSRVNVGAGTITCNYDGVNKHVTEIGDGAFIGSDTALVAPVSVGAGAYIGAGSTITQDVPAGALGVARGRQRNIEGWSARKAKK